MSHNIKVAIRIRPLIESELKSNKKVHWHADGSQIIAQNESPFSKFTFDRVFCRSEDNTMVYQELCAPLVEAAMSGFNGTVFAYGQTSSGKTFTMYGQNGVITNAVEDIFAAIDNMAEKTFLIRVSFIEIYNENLIDLIAGENKKLKIKEDADGVVNVTGLTETEIKCLADVFQVLKVGERRRSVGETEMNEKSSRSHSIFRMIIESRLCNGTAEDDVCVAHLNFVDLAGSERATQNKLYGVRFKESININRSLLSLTTVIRQLSDAEKGHVSYRDSKLTRILQNSLGGNAHTVIICTVTPASVEQTLSTLKFADRAKHIKNKPVVNVVSTDKALLKKYDKQIKKLTDKLEELQRQTENPLMLQQLEETNKQNEDLKLQIKSLKEKFLVSQTKEQCFPNITKANRRETWCFGLNRMRAPLEANRNVLKPLPMLREEDSACALLSDAKDEPLPCESTSSDLPDVFSPEHKIMHSSTQTMDCSSQIDALQASVIKLEKQVLSLKKEKERVDKELSELKEFTTLEKQIYCDDSNSSFKIEALKNENEELKQTIKRIQEEFMLERDSLSNLKKPVCAVVPLLMEQAVQVDAQDDLPWETKDSKHVQANHEESPRESENELKKAVQVDMSTQSLLPTVTVLEKGVMTEGAFYATAADIAFELTPDLPVEKIMEGLQKLKPQVLNVVAELRSTKQELAAAQQEAEANALNASLWLDIKGSVENITSTMNALKAKNATLSTANKQFNEKLYEIDTWIREQTAMLKENQKKVTAEASRLKRVIKSQKLIIAQQKSAHKNFLQKMEQFKDRFTQNMKIWNAMPISNTNAAVADGGGATLASSVKVAVADLSSEQLEIDNLKENIKILEMRNADLADQVASLCDAALSCMSEPEIAQLKFELHEAQREILNLKSKGIVQYQTSATMTDELQNPEQGLESKERERFLQVNTLNVKLQLENAELQRRIDSIEKEKEYLSCKLSSYKDELRRLRAPDMTIATAAHEAGDIEPAQEPKRTYVQEQLLKALRPQYRKAAGKPPSEPAVLSTNEKDVTNDPSTEKVTAGCNADTQHLDLPECNQQ